MRPVQKKPGEQGYALLILFLMSAAIAYSLYQQLPRVAFESAREKEQLLMDRGNQYKRAIQVYYAVNKRYPAKIEDLENTNNQRFLRRRYIDPMTGKDEWRLIHSNGSALTDSLVVKPPSANAQNTNLPGAGPLGTNTMNSAPAAATNPASANGQAVPVQVNAAVTQRPSDRTVAGLSQNGGQNGQNPNGQNLPTIGFPVQGAATNYDPSDPRTWPAITIAPQTANGAPNGALNSTTNGNQANAAAANSFPFPGANPTGVGQATQNQFNQAQFNQQLNQNQFNQGNQQVQVAPGGIFNGAIPSNGLNGQQPGLGGQNPQQLNVTSQDMNASPSPNAAPSPFGDGAPNPALGLISDQLNRAAPSPPQQSSPAASLASGLASAIQSIFPGVGSNNGNAPSGATQPAIFNGPQAGAQPGAPNAGTMGGPGIAGVATKFEGPSIKSYKDRQKYQEWEFVYDPSEMTAQGGQSTATPQNPLQPNAAPPGFGLPQTGTGSQSGASSLMPGQSLTNQTPAQSSPFGLPAQVP